MSVRSATALAVCAEDEWTVIVIFIGVWARFPCACAMSIPLENASAASALKKATRAVRAIGIGRETRVVLMSMSLSVV